MKNLGRVVGCVLALAMLSMFTLPLHAQSVEVLPPIHASENGGTGNYIPIAASTGGAYQVLYEPSQLVGLPIGGRITSIQLRQRNVESLAWPPANAVCADYEIRLGTSTRTVATISTTFADNISGPVLVRDGVLNIAAGSYPGGPATGSTPEAWGPVIAFSTPYIYTGGPLVIEFRNSGTGALVQFADVSISVPAAAGLATTTSQTAATGGPVNPLVVRLGIEPASTQFATLPNANESVAGTTANSIPIGAFFDGRHMSLYAANQLAAIPPGSIITGMQLRLRNAETASWPGADSTNADYEITLSQSNLTPATASTTFATNQLNPVLVHDGPYFLPAGAYPAGTNTGTVPEPWGPLIAFQTPYVYRGGVLAIDIKSVGGVAPIAFCDLTPASAAIAGMGASPRNAATASSVSSGFIVRLSYVTPDESPFGEGVTKIYALKTYADTPAPSTQSVVSFAGSFASEFVFGPQQFQTVGPGTELTALSFRNNDAVAWPPAPTTATSYSIELSKSLNGPATLSTTIANNIGADNTVVRGGSLSVTTGEMVAAPALGTAPFTWQIPFSTPYSYRSGSLLSVFRNSGFASTGNVDAIHFNAPEIGVQTGGFFGSPAATASTPIAANVPVMRFSADAQVIIPNIAQDGTGLGGTYSPSAPTSEIETAFQVIVGASELSYVPVGGLITSISLLASGTQAAWPDAAGAFADDLAVEISSAARQPLNMSPTFADNTGSDAVIVRSGPITWPQASLPAGSTGRYGATITFDRGFVYAGGPLCITFRHSPVFNGGPILRAANPAAAIRVVFATGDKTSISGSFFGTDSGPAIQLGYIPSDVTPKSARNSDGTAGNRFIFAGNRAYQMLYNADQVGVPVGATINGVSFRIDNETLTPFFPAADFTLDRFDITMSTATTTAATMNDTFATNEGSDVTTVRSGPITIPKGSYPGFTPQRPFGLFIPFTRPFVYKGGPITMLLRNGVDSGATSNVAFDATNSGAAGKRALGNADALSASGTPGAIIARFAFTDDAFCPADLNNDGVVDDLDFQVFVVAYDILDCAEPSMAFGCLSDLNYDRVVDDLDFQVFIIAYDALLCP